MRRRRGARLVVRGGGRKMFKGRGARLVVQGRTRWRIGKDMRRRRGRRYLRGRRGLGQGTRSQGAGGTRNRSENIAEDDLVLVLGERGRHGLVDSGNFPADSGTVVGPLWREFLRDGGTRSARGTTSASGCTGAQGLWSGRLTRGS